MNKECFFDRSSHLEILQKRVYDLKNGYRQNLAIIGDEFVGKTSIIFNFLSKFFDPHIIPIYLEARPESLSSFTRRFIGVFLYNFLLNSEIPMAEDINYLINKSRGFIPRTTERITAILAAIEKRKKINVFSDLLGLCEIIKNETGKSCVVIFDEFHNLEKIGSKRIYSEWSKLLVSQKNTMYIIISSLKYHARNILSKELSLLFGNFEVINVEPFDIKTSEQYLSKKFKELNVCAPQGIKNFLVHFTGGSPFYLEMLAENYAKNPQKDLALVLENILFEPTGALNQRFSIYMKRLLDANYGQDYMSIIYLIAKGNNKIKEICLLTHKPQKEILQRINGLLELDCITRSGDFLCLSDRVFAFWIKFVYQRKLNSLTFDAKNQKDLFISNFKEIIEEFLRNTQRPVGERIQELLGMFCDETIQMERKRLKLTHFREVKPLEFNRRALREGLIGRSHDALWIIALKEETLTEEDISDFAKECKKYRHKLQRKIIVTFRDVDTNARLRAMEEKILTWDLDHLNQLFDLFSKPRVIAYKNE